MTYQRKGIDNSIPSYFNITVLSTFSKTATAGNVFLQQIQGMHHHLLKYNQFDQLHYIYRSQLKYHHQQLKCIRLCNCKRKCFSTFTKLINFKYTNRTIPKNRFEVVNIFANALAVSGPTSKSYHLL